MCSVAPNASMPPGSLAVSEGIENQGLTKSLAAPTVNAGKLPAPAPGMSSAGAGGMTSQQILELLMQQLGGPGYQMPGSPMVSMM